MRRADAERLFDYLYLRDAPSAAGAADVIIGFGHFDLKIPRRCVELQRAGAAPLVVFTGGIGAGTADLGQPEALAFRDEALGLGLEESALLLESVSSNTGENLEETARLLERRERPFGTRTRSALIVANAYRQRRVYLTCLRHEPGVRWRNAPPRTSFDEELRMYAQKGQDLAQLLVGEVERLQAYPARGFCEAVEVPAEVLAAAGLGT